MPDTFTSSDQYVRTFEPLMLKEIEALIDNGLEECISWEGCRSEGASLHEDRGFYSVSLKVPNCGSGMAKSNGGARKVFSDRPFLSHDFCIVSTMPPSAFAANQTDEGKKEAVRAKLGGTQPPDHTRDVALHKLEGRQRQHGLATAERRAAPP